MTIGLFAAMIVRELERGRRTAGRAGTTRSTVPNASSSLRGDHRAGEEHRAQLVLGHEAREVRRDAERAAVDLGEAEGRVVGGDDDVGVAGEPDAAAEAEAVHRRDHGTSQS